MSSVDPFALYAQTTLLAEALARCPLENPEALIAAVSQVDRAPNPAALADDSALAAHVVQQYERVCGALGRVRLTLGERLELAAQPPLLLGVGLPRWVVVEVHNVTQQQVVLGASFTASSPDPSAQSALPPGKTAPLLVKLAVHDPRQRRVRLTLSGGPDPRESTVEVPVQVRPLAALHGILDAPGKVWVRCADGTLRVAAPPGDSNTLAEKFTLTPRPPGTYRLPFFYCEGAFTLEVPPGPTELWVERGFEYTPQVVRLVLAPGEKKTVRLAPKRFIDMRRKGWFSGDTHVHWVKNHWSENEDLRLLKRVQRAEDLHVANNLILKHRSGTAQVFLAPSQFPVGPVAHLSDAQGHLEMGEEYRNEGLYGHMVFLNLKTLIEPVSTGQGILGEGALDWPLNRPAILEARRQGGISIEAHQLPFEQPANLIDGVTDSLDQLDPELYYQVLDCGFRLPLTNGSDHPARTVGSARCYVYCDGPFTYARWIEGIRRGRTFTTSGPLLELSVNGKGIGEEVRVRRGEPLTIQATCHSRHPIGALQILSNHQTLAERTSQATRLSLSVTVPADQSRWIVCRAARGSEHNALLAPDVAHTSGIYVVVEGQPIFRPDAARRFADQLYRHAETIQTRGRFADDGQRQAARKLVLDAARAYERKIEAHQRALQGRLPR